LSSWKNNLSWALFIVFIIVLIFFADNIYKNQRCKKVTIEFDTKAEGYLITTQTINNLLTENGNKPISGTKFSKINFANLEQKILKNKLIKNCQISRSLGSNLLVKVSQKNPIARIVAFTGQSDTFFGYYLDEKGGLFPLSQSYTKRVVLISGKYLVGKNNLRSKKDKNIIDFISTINSDPFWQANITHIIIDEDQNINLIPLVGDYTIEYGIPDVEEFEIKMKKIKIFYQQIDANYIGKYKSVSVRYSNQIVCQLKEYKPEPQTVN
jgi:cell division protein FtsQ